MKTFEKLREFLESEDGKRAMEEYFRKIEETSEINKIRYERFEQYLKTNSFDTLMDRVKLDNDETYEDKCYAKGSEPYPTNIFNFIINYVSDKCPDANLNVGNTDFLSEEYEFKGYLFQTFQGQGAFERVYKKVNGEWEFFLQI